ncbi:Gfo/Idh/MocA family protein [Halalkalibacter alkaliphilus]|uniref:Gfo/Idh/MocA family oxidoreductase n=1 Tax=Halalkalibacter alkaliphilus TaxID=2917993 RepID=A0A9X2CXL5_9BACI|nr:Gfo/Idh/MocA family oxidoreductase [Halalkalibacter alkaliphilus]MCL7749930.1 Gfo/Idh/MocA family oxidoreductase [Halalkalibacter alkaliphilus]
MAENKRYSVGFIGAGHVTKMHLDGLMKNKDRVDVTAICDMNPEVLNERADTYDIKQRFTELNKFIDESNVDIAIVCTPSVIRKDVIFPLIEAGIPIFCEKPFSETLEEAKEIVEKAKKHGVPISVNQNFRTHYPFDFVKNLIQKNEIGSVSSVKFQDFYFRQDKGWRTQCERNSLSVMGVHWLDGFRWILDSEAKSLSCQTYSSPAIDCVGDTDSSVQILFQNGVTVSYSQSLSSTFNRTELIVVGETGTVVADYTTISLYRKGSKEPVKTWKNPTGGPDLKPDSTFNGLDLLIQSIERNESASNNGEDNLKTISLLEGAYLSADKQNIVKFDTDGILIQG